MDKGSSYLLMAIISIVIIALIYVTTRPNYLDDSIKVTYQDEVYVDTNLRFSVVSDEYICFGPVYTIKCNEDEDIVREYNIKINKEMDIISKFIKKRNNRVPLLVADQMAHSIVTKCEEDNMPTELIIGIIEVESLYDPYAIGPPVGGNQLRRARGLGQILDPTCGGVKVSKDKLHNIDYNVDCIVDKMNEKLKITGGDVEKSLYYYVGKDDKYAPKVFKVMGEFRYFRTQNI